MTRRILGLALLLACPSLAWADVPNAVVGPVEPVQAGDICLIDASASTGDVFQWEMLSQKRLIPSEDGRRAYFAAGQPGKYKFLLIVAGTEDGKAKLSTARVVVEVLGPTPDPTPTPGPTPGPPPTPDPPAPAPVVSGPLHVSLVTDLDALQPDMTAVRVGLKIRDQQAPLRFTYRTYPSTSPSVDSLRFRELVNRVGLPALLIQDEAGRLLSVEAAPTDEDSVLAKVRKIRGQN